MAELLLLVCGGIWSRTFNFNKALLNNKDYVIVRILKVKKSYTCLISNIHLQALPFILTRNHIAPYRISWILF